MHAAKVLLIQSARANGNSFAPALNKRYDLLVAFSGKQGLSLTQAEPPDVVVVDAVSMRISGDRIFRSLRAQLPDSIPVIHIRPTEGQEGTSASPADVVLHPPLTWRKLVNRIKPFLERREEKAGDVLQVSTLTLNIPKRLLTVGEQENRLTPKLTSLAELFLRHPNATLDRETLIRAVWNTDYMGDTRTLDVHIRWLREVVETNPSRPCVITTVRGVGYRLVPPPDGGG